MAASVGLLILLFCTVTACGDRPWNEPYSGKEAERNILYSAFSERPKHLDPARSYTAGENTFLAQIYEPPLQYHFLKRPYELVPFAADGMPVVRYFDSDGVPLSDGAPAAEVAFSEYEIRIRSGIRYQPHPAFAVSEGGGYLYHDLAPEVIESANTLADFPETGSREATAQDYVYQLKRLAFPRLNSPIAGLMSEHILGMAQYGKELDKAYAQARRESGEADPWLDLRRFELEGVQVLDRYRYRIRLKGRYPQFIYWLAMTFFAPMPWEADAFYHQPGMKERNITLDWYPVGSGPFMLTENNPNLRMVLTRNPNFHGETYPGEGMPEDREAGLLEDAGKPLPFIEKAVYSRERENIPYWNKFLQGYFDASGISSDSFDQAVRFNTQGEAGLTDEMREKGIKLVTAVETSVFFIGFNMLDPVVGGDSERARLLRRAISIAVDYEEFLSIFTNGRGVAAQGPLPPGIFGYRAGEAGINPYVYDWVGGAAKRKSVEEARALMAQAGYAEGIDRKSGKPLSLYYEVPAAGPDSKARLNWMRKQFKKLGIQLVIRASDYNRFQEKIRMGTGQIFFWGWNGDYPDPENFLFLLYGPNGKVKQGGENSVNYSNPRFDALFNRMKDMENGPERQAVIDQMVEILRRDAPWVYGFFPKGFSLHHAWYQNVKPNLMANNTLKYKRLDPELRNRKRAEWNPPVLWPLWLLLALLALSVIPAVYTHRRRERSTAL